MEFENLDQLHASMWHWVRRNMTYGMLKDLTNSKDIALEHLSDIEIDRMLRNSYDHYMLQNSVKDISEKSKIKSGILPQGLGAALLKYAEAIRTETLETTCKQIFGDRQSKEHTQKLENEISKAFIDLCNEIAKTR